MRVFSLGFRTDLALRLLGGSEIVDRAGYVVARTRANPGHWWGNFVLLPGPVKAGQESQLLSIFNDEVPGAAHVAFGIDGTQGEVGDADVVSRLGLTAEVNAVLTAEGLREPVRADRGAVVRPLVDDDDWEQAGALRLAVYPADAPTQSEFAARQLQEAREICERGAGSWFGAFAEDRLVAALGLLRASAEAARYQSVETHPDHRRRGLASRLLYESSVWARETLEVREVVIVADPAYHAIEVYRSLGFTVVERQAQLERAPATG